MKTTCSICGAREAVLHYRENINGREKEYHLCPQCAKEKGMGAFHEDLGFFSPLMSPFTPREERSCPHCKTTLAAVKKKGVFGCPSCYEAFQPFLDLSPFVGQGYTGGRLTLSQKEKEKKEEEKPSLEGEIKKMKQELRRAVEEENYEKAALLRDKIRETEGK